MRSASLRTRIAQDRRTRRTIEPVLLPIVAEIKAIPSKYEVRRLQLTSPPADTVATLDGLELQAALPVTSCVGPNEYVPVAIICRVPPLGISPDEFDVTEMDWSTGA